MATKKSKVSVNTSVESPVHFAPLSKDVVNEMSKRIKIRESLCNAYCFIESVCLDAKIPVPSGFRNGFLEIWEQYTTNNPMTYA